MIHLKIVRQWFTERSTCGVLYVNDVQFSYTLEPPTRLDKPCAIPLGIYTAKLYLSPKHGYRVPLLVDVPGFEDIEIHIGNYPYDTEGCTLVGGTHDFDWVGHSEVTFDRLMTILKNELVFMVEYKNAGVNE